MNAPRLLAAILLWTMALVPLGLGGILVVHVLWPVYRTGAASSVTSVSVAAMGFLPGFSLGDGEIAPFVFGCLLVAASFITAGYFVVAKRSDDDAPSRE